MPTSAWEPDTCCTEQIMFNESRPDWWLGQHLIEEELMKTSEMTQSKYMKAADLDEDTVVTVAKVGQINLAREGAAPDMKWAIRFKEFDKPMVLNKTNIKRLEKALGDETDNWPGKQVVLFVDEVDYQGDLVPAIRIKAHHGSKSQPGKGGALGDMSDDVPFAPLGKADMI